MTDRLRSCRTSFASTHRHPEQVCCFHGDDRRLWGHIEPTFKVLEAGNQTGAHDCNTWACTITLHGCCCCCRGFKDLTIRYRQKGSASKQLGGGGWWWDSGGWGVLQELGRFFWQGRAQNTHLIALNANARTWDAWEERLEFLLYGNFMPISPADPFNAAQSFSFSSEQQVETHHRALKWRTKNSSALHPRLIDQKDTRKARRRSSRPARNPPTGRL